jgi:hypothetical protein
MNRLVYPRLPLAIAKARLDEIRLAYWSRGLDGVRHLVEIDHPRAAPVATGGSPASKEQIRSVRQAVEGAVNKWVVLGTVASDEIAAFDRILGRALYESMQIIPADAAHDEMWSFITLVVFPDLAVLRFPDLHEDRLLGKPRNALRRTWLRHEVIGDLLFSASRPLREDELVGLFERSAVARNRSLVRRLTIIVQEYNGPGRSKWARKLYRDVTVATGPRLLDAVSDEELDALIRGDEEQLVPSSALGATAVDPLLSWSLSGDLATGFERALMNNYLQARRELGYEIPGLLAKITDSGGVTAATELITDEQWPLGFLYLKEQNRLDLSIEALATMDEFRQLFDRYVLGLAELRLQASGWPRQR